MAATRVQTVPKTQLDNTNTTITIGSTDGWATPKAGNVIVVVFNGVQTATTPTGYTAGPSVVDDNAGYLYWKVAAGTETSVAVTQAGTNSATLTAFEISGLLASPADVQNTAAAPLAAGTSTSVASITTTGVNGDYVLAVAALCRDTSTAGAAPTGFTWTNGYTGFLVTQSVGNGAPADDEVTAFAELQQAAPGATSTVASWTNAWQARQHLIIGFKLAAGAAPVAPPPGILFIGPTRG